MDKYIGKKLDGRYEVLELIGIGGMANVYRGRDLLEGNLVAIKVLRSEFAENEEFLRRFKNESKAIAMLSHSNIVKVFDVSFTTAVHFIVMEYIAGITLKDYIQQQQIISWKEAAHFTLQILRGLQHAHDKGIVHRDVKPQNIMLLSDGTIKITDFGIARFARSGSRTITDRAIGSVHYISPEQASGNVTDQRTDIYAVGVMLYEMLTGELPFEADTPLTVALKQIQDTAKAPSQINPDIPKPLEEIIIHAMRKDVDMRYQSAAEMLKDFDEFKKNPRISFAYKYDSSPEVINTRAVKKVLAQKKQQGVKEEGLQAETEKKPSPVDMIMAFGESMKEKITPKKTPRKQTTKSAPKKSQETQPKVKTSEEKPETFIPMVSVMAGITTAFVLVTGIFVFNMFYVNNPFGRVEETRVPELIGMQYDALSTTQSVSENFEIEVETTDYHPTFGAGVIYEQHPDPGRTVKVGSVITIKVSSGQKEVVIPEVVGKEAADAYGLLDSVGLDYTIEEIFDDSLPIGTIVSIVPSQGTTVQSGDVLEIQVSIGKESKLVMVPALVGMKIDDAEILLENFKLDIGGQSTEISDLPKGTIISQSPTSGVSVNEDSFINVVVSAGDGQLDKLRLTIPMPNIDRDISVQGMMDGVITVSEVLNPSEVTQWKPIFEGEGVSNIQIIVNNDVYQVITLNFDEKTYRIEADNSAEFTQ